MASTDIRRLHLTLEVAPAFKPYTCGDASHETEVEALRCKYRARFVLIHEETGKRTIIHAYSDSRDNDAYADASGCRWFSSSAAPVNLFKMERMLQAMFVGDEHRVTRDVEFEMQTLKVGGLRTLRAITKQLMILVWTGSCFRCA